MASLERRRVAELDCHIVTSEKPPLYSAIFCHGFGAPGDDLVPLAAQLLQLVPELLDQVQFVFPAAPLTLDQEGIPGGRAWWPIDMDRLTHAVQTRDYSQFRRDVPPELPFAREKLMAFLQELCETNGQTHSQLVLGGFSQGAMLATDVALRLPSPPAGLVIWSGTLLNEGEWTSLAPQLKRVPVVQSHGKDDPILPYEPATWLRDLLSEAGANLNFIGFRGGHTIPREGITAVAQMLQRLLGIVE